MKKIFLFLFILIIGCLPKKQFYSEEVRSNVNIFNILTVDVKFVNKEKEPIKDFFYTCYTYGASGTATGYKTERIYQIVPPQSEVLVKNINMGFINPQTSKIECHPSTY
jgi:hypothetical protein